jgi:hypothetical protein
VGGDDVQLENVGAKYQCSMNLIFHELLGTIVEVYIDDVVIKSSGFESHMGDLRLAFEKMQKYGLRMNPLKCAFGVSVGRFLGFVVHKNGIEIDSKKIETINNIKEPTNLTEVQSLLGKVNYLRCFISNLAGRVEPMLPLVRLKYEKGFVWGIAQQEAFERIKGYLIRSSAKVGFPYRLYVAATNRTLGAVLTQDHAGKEYAIAYLSRRMIDVETRYAHMEKLWLSLYFACS